MRNLRFSQRRCWRLNVFWDVTLLVLANSYTNVHPKMPEGVRLPAISFPRSRCDYVFLEYFICKIAKLMISGCLSPRHGAPSGCGWRNGLQIWRVAETRLNKQSRRANNGWSSSLGLGEVLKTHHLKKIIMLRHIQKSLGIWLILRYDLTMRLCSVILTKHEVMKTEMGSTSSTDGV